MDKVKKIRKKHFGEQPYTEILECYQHEVYQICFYMIGKRNEAEQIAQAAFIEMYMNISDYNLDKVSSKLFRITVDLVLDWLEERTTYHYMEIGMAESIEPIQKEILQLPVNNRLTIVLKHIVGLSVEEISEIMQFPISRVRRKIYCSREVLCQQVINNE